MYENETAPLINSIDSTPLMNENGGQISKENNDNHSNPRNLSYEIQLCRGNDVNLLIRGNDIFNAIGEKDKSKMKFALNISPIPIQRIENENYDYNRFSTCSDIFADFLVYLIILSFVFVFTFAAFEKFKEKNYLQFFGLLLIASLLYVTLEFGVENLSVVSKVKYASSSLFSS